MDRLMLVNAVAYKLGVVLAALGAMPGIYLMVATSNAALIYLLSRYPRSLT